MDTITLDAQPRETGKAATKAIRRAEEVPCVLYGPHQEPLHFRVPVLDMRPLIYTAETHRVAVHLDGESYDCLLKEVSFDPITDVPRHADFQALTAGETIKMTVPLQLVGMPKGVKDDGGELLQPLNEIEIECLPKDIPSHAEADVSELGIGDSLHLSDVTLENVTFLTDLSRTIATVVAPRKEEVEETEDLLGLAPMEGEEAPEGEGAEEAAEEDAE